MNCQHQKALEEYHYLHINDVPQLTATHQQTACSAPESQGLSLISLSTVSELKFLQVTAP